MTNILNQVQSKPKAIGQVIVIAGAEGSGKSTLLDQTPGRLFVPTEIGGGRPNSTPLLTKWEDVLGLVDEIIASAQAGKFPYKSIAWDSATAMERLLFDYTVRSDPKSKTNSKLSMATAHDAYGKAYQYAFDRFAEFIAKIDVLAQYGGIHSFFACHTFVNRVIDTDNGEYDTTDLLLYSPKDGKKYGQRELLRQRADMIGIIHEPMVITKGDKSALGTSLNRGRMLAVSATPAFGAKNRFNLTEDISIPQKDGWNYVADQIFKSTEIDLYNREGTN